jgi:hypothetical protein
MTGPGQPASATIQHELVHVAQWRAYGEAFPQYYFAAGSNPYKNKFEIQAGLTNGGY